MSQALLESSPAVQLIGLCVGKHKGADVILLNTDRRHVGSSGKVNPFLVFPIMLAAAGHVLVAGRHTELVGEFTFVQHADVEEGNRLFASAELLHDDGTNVTIRSRIVLYDGELVASCTYGRRVISGD